MHNRCSQFDVAHALAANFGTGDFNATTLTNNSLKANTLVFTAVALPVTGWSENLFTEKTIFFGSQCAVVNCLWLFYFAFGPQANLIRSG